MKRLPALSVILLSFFLLVSFASSGRAQQRQQPESQSPPATQSPPVTAKSHGSSAIAPNASGSVAAQEGIQPEARRELQCQNCHATGKPLPYLGGAQFHADEHTNYNAGFHAKAAQAGHKAATCLDCHTRGGDLTTMLPKSDPRSTINRSNLAETCGKCHGDPSMMKGTGISERPFISYRESVHAQAVARGNPNAAVCTDCHRA